MRAGADRSGAAMVVAAGDETIRRRWAQRLRPLAASGHLGRSDVPARRTVGHTTPADQSKADLMNRFIRGSATVALAALVAVTLPSGAGARSDTPLPMPPAERRGLDEVQYVLAQQPDALTPPVAAVDASGAPLPGSDDIVLRLAAQDGRTVTFSEPTTIDFGRYVTGVYTRPGATADPASAFPDFVRTRLPGFGAKNALRHGDWHPARYVTLPAGEPIDVVGFVMNTDPVRGTATLGVDPAAVPGAFLASDEDLTRIWYASLQTMQLSMMAAAGESTYRLYDGPERDRQQWLWYDSTANRAAYYGLGDLALPTTEATYRAAACAPSVFAVNTSCVPTILGDDLGFTQGELWEVLEFYGNSDFFAEPSPTGGPLYPAHIVSHLETHVAKQLDPATGLYRTNRLAVPPAPLNPASGNDHSMPTQMWVYRGFVAAAEIARAHGDEAIAQVYELKAAALREAVDAHLWDEDRGAYVYFIGSDHVDQLGNAMAVVYGLASPERSQRIVDYFQAHHNRVYDWRNTGTWGALNPAGSTNFDRPFLAGDPDFTRADWDPPHSGLWGAAWGMGEDPDDFSRDYNYNYSLSPWAQAYEVEAEFLVDRDAEAISLLRRAWGTALDWGPGTFYEQSHHLGEPAYRLGSQHNSVDHRWGAGPAYLLPQYVLGVTPTSPGFATWRIDPHRVDLEWAQGRVPTPAGPLSTWWEVDGDPADIDAMTLVVDAPPGTAGEVALPVPASGVVTLDGDTIMVDGLPLGASARRDAARDRTVVTGLSGQHVLRWSRG
jgi:hypothetical protein